MGQGGSSRELGRVAQAWAGWQPGSQAWQQRKGGDVWPHTPHPTTRPPPPSVKEVRMFMSLKRSTCGLHAVRGSVRAGVRILGGLKPVGGQFLCSALFWEGPHCGENGISPNWPVESWWDPRHVPGRVLADAVPWVRLDSNGFCGKTGSRRGWVSLFFAAVCPGKAGVPPARCPPCPTLPQSKRCAATSCTWLCRPRGRPVFRPTCGVHAVRCLGSLFLGETGGFPAK